MTIHRARTHVRKQMHYKIQMQILSDMKFLSTKNTTLFALEQKKREKDIAQIFK